MHPIVFVSDPPLLNNISDTKPCPLFPHTFRLSMDFHYNEALILQPIIHGTIQSEFVVYWVGFNLWSSCVNTQVLLSAHLVWRNSFLKI